MIWIEEATDNREGRFSIATKAWVLVLTIVVTTLGLGDGAQALLSLATIAYAACAGRMRMTYGLLMSFAFIAAIYVSFTYFGLRPLFFRRSTFGRAGARFRQLAHCLCWSPLRQAR